MQSSKDPLSRRVLKFVEQANEAYTAEEIASHVAGHTGRYAAALVLEPKVEAVLPTVTEILDELALHHKIRKAILWFERAG